jgi:flagellar motor switch protein FliM
MTATALENPALRRMLRPAAPVTTGSRMSEAKAWRSSVPRVAENLISAVVTVTGYRVGGTDLDAMLEGWSEFVLALLLKGPDDAKGLVQVDDALRTGLIEAQTVGRPLDTELTGRPGTAIDAALCDHVVNAWLAGAAEAGGWANDWSAVRIVKGARAAKVALADGDYETIEVTLSIGEGERSGTMRILRPVLAVRAQDGAAPVGGGGHAGFLRLEAEIEAILYQTKVPYDWLRSLKPGAVLEVPRRAIDHVQLRTVEGKRITRARLGQLGGKRAVRLLDEDAPDAALPRPAAAASAFSDDAATGLPGLASVEPDSAGGFPDIGAALNDLPDLASAGAPAGLPDIPGLPPLGDDN